ncbi:MAG: sigma-70 family RNA polymerase sigma factor [Bacteroidota bacterium]|jgi:RNA polymerase sigma factor for flagellar operon FliA
MSKPSSFSSPLHATNISSAAMRDIVLQHFGLVKSIARSIAFRSTKSGVLTEDDLVQYGMFGLIDAIERFDAHKGVKFETFAYHRIRGAILDGLRAVDVLSRAARKQQREQNERNDIEYLTMMKLKMNVGDYQLFMQENDGASMNLQFAEVESSYLESLPDDEHNSPFEVVNEQQTREILYGALEQLPERERLIVTLYYYEGLTFKEIGKILKISESRVFQIHSDAIVQLRSKLEPKEMSL